MRRPLRIRTSVGREYCVYWDMPPPGARRLDPSHALSILRSAVSRGEATLGRLASYGSSLSGPLGGSTRQQWAQLESALRRREMVVVELGVQRESRSFRHDVIATDARAEPTPAPTPAPIEADERSLLISRCDSRLLDGPLTFTYVLRGLEGKPCKLRIVSDSYPNLVVHERDLSAAETSDGPHDAEWDGVVTSGGPLEGQRLTPSYSPARVEIVHDEHYRDQAPFTLSRLVHIVEIEDLVFATGRALFMPDGSPGQPDESARSTGLDAIAAVLRHAAFHEEETLAVFGHTDTVGSDASNLELSQARADNVLHLLTGDAEAWADHCHQHFDIADYQRVLAWVARNLGWDTDPGEVDGDFGPITRSARFNFRELMNAEYGTSLEQGTKQGPADWAAYFTLFEEHLLRLLAWHAEDLERVREHLQLGDPATIGCGEAFPEAGAGQNNLASATNRRVDFVFFAPDELPELPGDPPGHELYGTEDYEAKFLPYGPSELEVPFRLRLTQAREPLGAIEYVIEHLGAALAQGKTNAEGYILTQVPKDAKEVSLHLPEQGLTYAVEVGALEPLSSLAGVQQRLTNLGYHCSRAGVLDPQTEAAIMAFQRDEELPATGAIDPDTLVRLRVEHRS